MRFEVYHEDGFTDFHDFQNYQSLFTTFTRTILTVNGFSAYLQDGGFWGLWYTGSRWAFGSWYDMGGSGIGTWQAGSVFNDGDSICVHDMTPAWNWTYGPNGTAPSAGKGLGVRCIAPPPNCGNLNGPSGTVTSPEYPEPPPDGMVACQWSVECDGGNKTLYVKSKVGYELDYSCEGDVQECKDKWPKKKCSKKCNKKMGPKIIDQK